MAFVEVYRRAVPTLVLQTVHEEQRCVRLGNRLEHPTTAHVGRRGGEVLPGPGDVLHVRGAHQHPLASGLLHQRVRLLRVAEQGLLLQILRPMNAAIDNVVQQELHRGRGPVDSERRQHHDPLRVGLQQVLHGRLDDPPAGRRAAHDANHLVRCVHEPLDILGDFGVALHHLQMLVCVGDLRRVPRQHHDLVAPFQRLRHHHLAHVAGPAKNADLHLRFLCAEGRSEVRGAPPKMA
mmetsp:Transcript_26637/g.80275  ORF Transcript_26637/g.80275 Transcript_26637/m.80275 type:complete len:236 (+) Transcript_26637:106-813(+)